MALIAGTALVYARTAAAGRDTDEVPSRQLVAARAVRSNVLLVPIRQMDGVQGVGSAFFVDDRGTLVSSYHALQHADSVAIITADEQHAKRVELLAVDRLHDLVLLRVAPPVPAYLALASVAPAVGETVYTVGNPLGQMGSFAEGVLSAVRALPGAGMAPETVTVLQVSAPISQGSSGGAVLNARGEVVGVAARVRDDGENVGFAVHLTHVVALLRARRTPVLFTRQEMAAWAGPDTVEYPLEVGFDDGYAPSTADEGPNFHVPTEALSQIQTLIHSTDSVAALDGYQPYSGIEFVSIPSLGTHTVNLALPPGAYRMAVVCDSACNDVDLRLVRGAIPELAAEDAAVDAHSEVAFTVVSRDSVQGEVRMVMCRTAVCVVGVRMWKREASG